MDELKTQTFFLHTGVTPAPPSLPHTAAAACVTAHLCAAPAPNPRIQFTHSIYTVSYRDTGRFEGFSTVLNHMNTTCCDRRNPSACTHFLIFLHFRLHLYPPVRSLAPVRCAAAPSQLQTGASFDYGIPTYRPTTSKPRRDCKLPRHVSANSRRLAGARGSKAAASARNTGRNSRQVADRKDLLCRGSMQASPAPPWRPRLAAIYLLK